MMDLPRLAEAAKIARGLAIDAVHACSSGHLGLPLGSAEMGAVLFGYQLQLAPEHPRWLNRDRFILSAGHGSMFLYSWLHLSGFELPLEQIKNFRQLHSITPGHPEFRETPGVEATTGPLGQGVGNAVGYALSGKMLAERFNTPESTIFDYHVLALAGDGCLQEGVASEAAALAGHLGLDNLILIYDSNDVTLDAMARVTQSEDTAKRFEAYGFEVHTIDGHDMQQFAQTLEHCKQNDDGRPKFIVARTEIGRGIPEVAGTAKAHGEGGAKFAEQARRGLGLPESHFYVSDEVREFFAERQQQRAAAHQQWQQQFDQWAQRHPELARELADGISRTVPEQLIDQLPHFASDYADATRAAGGVVIQAIAERLPLLVTGSADLFGSTKNYLKAAGDISRENFAGRNIWFGIREHAMGAVLNGIAYDGVFFASGATFTVFADYMRPSIRLAALSQLPVTYIFTHDSVGVGEDGPTHQPVETCTSLRIIPGLDVIRPGDPEEVAGAFAVALARQDGPTALLLTRQKVATQHAIPVAIRRHGVLRGGYVAQREEESLRLILLATGSELELALEARQQLGKAVRVVSLPSFERFDRQSEAYREEVLPKACRRRLSVEAGVTGLWHKYVGPEGVTLGIDRFGLSAPGAEVMSELGMTVDHVVQAARQLLNT